MEIVGGALGKRALIRVVINGKFCREALVDTGATVNMCSKGHTQQFQMSIVPYSGGMVRGVGGKVNILGEAWGMLDFGPDRGMNPRKVKFLVVEDMEDR